MSTSALPNNNTVAGLSVEHPNKSLPLDGMSRWSQIAPFSPFSREKFRQLVNEGKAPQPVKFSERCTAYQNRELHKFFADPLNYSVTRSIPPSAQ